MHPILAELIGSKLRVGRTESPHDRSLPFAAGFRNGLPTFATPRSGFFNLPNGHQDSPSFRHPTRKASAVGLESAGKSCDESFTVCRTLCLILSSGAAEEICNLT